MLRQLLISVVVIVAAAAAYVFFVPGGRENLARLGIDVPFAEAATPQVAGTPGGSSSGAPGQAATGAPGAQGQGQGAGGGGRGGRGGNRTPVVVTAPVANGTINDKLTAIGDGAAAHSVTITAAAAGTLREILVSPGDTVKTGDVIARLDDDAEQIAVQRTTLALNDAETALKRAQELRRANSGTEVQVNAAQLAADNARLENQNAQLALTRRTITSPIGGKVGLFQVSAGNAITAQTAVTTVEDTSHIVVSFWVPERYASVVKPGLTLSATAVALPGEEMAGAVSAVDNKVDPASRTLQVQAELPNQRGELKPGMSFSVTLNFPGDTFPTVDPLAVQWSSAGPFVWRYAEGKVQRVDVEVIQRNSDGVLVKGDLQAGQAVVTQGLQQLAEGQSVRLLDELFAQNGNRQGGAGRQGNGAPAGQNPAERPGTGDNDANSGGGGGSGSNGSGGAGVGESPAAGSNGGGRSSGGSGGGTTVAPAAPAS